MKITDTKINGITNPIGFSFPSVKCSWKVTDARGCHQSNVKIMIASDAALENIITVKEGRELKSIGERLEVELKPRTRYYYNVKVTDESATVRGAKRRGLRQERWVSPGRRILSGRMRRTHIILCFSVILRQKSRYRPHAFM